MHKRRSTFFTLLLLAVLGVAGYFTISDMVGVQSQQHQQSVSPIFGLIESELVEPLHIATTLDKIGVYSEYFQQIEPDQALLLAQLKDYSERLDLEFYVAHEESRKQYNSDGRVFDLIEGKVIWYFTLKNETDSKVQAVLGNKDDVHLYIDVRQYDDNNKFTGFVGLGKSLNDFIISFERFKKEYGHEFIFVNNRDEIVLSSREDLLPSEAINADDVIHITNISSLPWHQQFKEQTQDQLEPSLVIQSGDGDMLISQLSIKSLNWSIYLLTPLTERQTQVSKSFALYFGLGVLVLFILGKLVLRLIDFYADKMNRKHNIDPLTQLPNRRYADLFFIRKRRQFRPTAVILIGLDDFTEFVAKNGHKAGDLVLQTFAKILLDTASETDLVARWGDDKFVILQPNKEQHEALELAKECCHLVQQHQANSSKPIASLSASAGVSCSRDLSDS
jgi:diguanylate cyclase (GGDEF)-like protein